MSSPIAASAPPEPLLREMRRPVMLLFLLGMVYTFGYLFWYSGSLLGLSPVLDGKENLLLAQQIAAGELPSEPFYRAMLYPGMLAGLLKVGVPVDLLPLVARLLNGAFHLLTAAFLFNMAWMLWRHRGAAVLASILWMFNPVALHFAGDPLDITLAVFLGTTGLYFWMLALNAPRHRVCFAIVMALFLVLATWARPHFLPVLLIAPLIVFVRHKGAGVVGLVTGIAGLALLGGINLARSGEFVILPTQGAFNFWAANHPGAHGRYFTQTKQVERSDDPTAAMNPARAESEMLYREATGAIESDKAGNAEPVDMRAMNAFWRQRARSEILKSPIRWLGLEFRKGYYLINNHEIYNNKTYAFHKERSPWLKHNPIGWGVVFAFGTAGLVFLWRIRTARWLLLIGTVYAFGVMLYYASARFRLPLAPISVLFASGAPFALFTAALNAQTLRLPRAYDPTAHPIFDNIPQGRFIGALAAFVAAGLITFSPLWDVQDPRTIVENKLLLAHASSEIARDAEAGFWARQVLEDRPDHPAALELAVLSDFNLRLIPARMRAEQRLDSTAYGPAPQDPILLGPVTDADLELAARAAATGSKPAQFVHAVYLYMTGRTAFAEEIWHALTDAPRTRTSALYALAITENLDESERAAFQEMVSSSQNAGQFIALEELLRHNGPE